MKKAFISLGAFCLVFLSFIFLVAAIGDVDSGAVENLSSSDRNVLVDEFITKATDEYENFKSVVGGDKYREWYIGGVDNAPWCATFISYIANETGILNVAIPKFQSCDAGVMWFSAKHQYHNTPNYGGAYDEPSKGDIIFFSQVHDKNDSTHVGIVLSCKNGIVSTIEGNSGNQIKMKSYAIDNKYIIGYAIPNY